MREAFLSFVRGEFGAGTRATPAFKPIPEFESRQASGEEPFIYLENVEKDLVYGGYLDSILPDPSASAAEAMLAILSDRRIGHGSNARNVDGAEFREQVQPLLDEQLRVRFVLPAFPFKDQNPFRVNAGAGAPDCSELALLIRLHALSLALYQVHPHGVDWIILSDGMLYAPLFGIETEEVQRYRQSLITWRNRLNLQGTVNIVDLGELIERLNGRPVAGVPDGPFDQVEQSVRDHLASLIESDDDCREKFSVLKRGMTWNLNLKTYLRTVSPQELWQLVRGSERDQLSAQAIKVGIEIDVRAEAAAFRYAAINLALRFLQGVDTILPGSIRATIHPKAGQVAVPTLGSVFPWNGVARLDGPFGADDLSVCQLVDIGSTGDFRGVVSSETGDVFYYEQCP